MNASFAFRLLQNLYCMDDMARRVVARYLEAAEKTPVRNKDTGRIVYVTPETLREDGSRFEPASHDDLKPEHLRGKPTPPKKPHKPRKPHRPKDPIPVPKPYVKPPLPPKIPKPVKPVRPVQPVKVLEPPRPRKTPLLPARERYKNG